MGEAERSKEHGLSGVPGLALLLALAGGCASDRDGGKNEALASEPQPARSSTETAAPPNASTSASSEAAKAPAPTPPAAPPAEPEGDRVYAKARHVWVVPAARPTRGWIGYLTVGGSVRLRGTRETAKELGPGCTAWYRVEPMGYVCVDGVSATLDPNDPEYVALAKGAADTTSPFPYAYGESLGAARYDAPPTEDQQREAEWDLDRHREKLAALAQDGKGTDPKYVGLDLEKAGAPLPDFPAFGPLVREARAFVAPGSTVAWSGAFDRGDRTWLVTSDRALVPKDRVRPYPESSFHGVKLGGEVKLPIAFFRKQDRPKLKRDDGRFLETGEKFSRLSWVMLTGEAATGDKGERFLETREPGIWVREKDAAVADQRGPVPYRADEAPGGRHTWVDASVLGGTLVAYEGEVAVFATLISGGRGGIPFEGRDPVSTASTPTGSFRVDGKFRTATMVSSSDSSIVHSEVQYVQNFHGPHALHGAYWHDAWGELKSGGCVNLSPLDSAWLFEWSEPKIPDGWYGVRSVEELGVPTRVRVRP